MRHVLIILFALLSACTPNAVNGQKVDNAPNTQKTQKISPTNQNITAHEIKHPQGEHATPAEIAECEKQGGKISKQGLLGHDFCVVEFADKGKVCTDGSDCQAGRCLVHGELPDDEVGTPTKGICPSNNIPFGCYGTVNQGKVVGFLCVD